MWGKLRADVIDFIHLTELNLSLFIEGSMKFLNLLINLILVIRKLSSARISGPHEPIIDLLEKRLDQSSQSTLLLRSVIFKAKSLWKVFEHQKIVSLPGHILISVISN